MKVILLFAGITISCTSIAQDQQEYFQRKMLEKYKPPVVKQQSFLSLIPDNTQSTPRLYSLPGGNRLTTLTQDNMPCIIPDMQAFNMPNAGKTLSIQPQGWPGAIPNPKIQSYPESKDLPSLRMKSK